MKRLQNIVTGVIWFVSVLYFTVIVLTHLSPVQKFLGRQVAEAVGNKLGTKVEVGRVNLGFLNRVIVDDVCIYDQQHERMLSSTRLSAKFDLLEMSRGNIAISSAQVFGMKANLYRATANAIPNYQFVLDSLASKDTTSHRPLDLAIHSLVVRHGDIRYSQRDVAPVNGRFQPKQLHLSAISGHVIVNKLARDSINIDLKTLSFKERSGLEVRKLNFHLVANTYKTELSNFDLQLPHSNLSLGKCLATYTPAGGDFDLPSLRWKVAIQPSKVLPSELSPFAPFLKTFNQPLKFTSSLSGKGTDLFCHNFTLASLDDSFDFSGFGYVKDWKIARRWAIRIRRMNLETEALDNLSKGLLAKNELKAILTRIGHVGWEGNCSGYGSNLSAKGLLTLDTNKANIAFAKAQRHISLHFDTKGIDLKRLLDDNRLGQMAAHLDFTGAFPLDAAAPAFSANGKVDLFEYNSYSYKNIGFNVTGGKNGYEGTASIDDANAKIALRGNINPHKGPLICQLDAKVDHINPHALGLTTKWPGAVFSFNLAAKTKGNTVQTATGIASLNNFALHTPQNEYSFDRLSLKATTLADSKKLQIESDFANMDIAGRYDYNTLLQSVANIIGNRLPTLPGLPQRKEAKENRISFNGELIDATLLSLLFNVPLKVSSPIRLNGYLNEPSNQLSLVCDLPSIYYNGTNYENGYLRLFNASDSLKAMAAVNRRDDDGHLLQLQLRAGAADNKLQAKLSFENNRQHRMRGDINLGANFFKDKGNHNSAHVSINPSNILVGDTVWTIQPSDIIYGNGQLAVNRFSVEHHKQHITVSGLGSASSSDSLMVDLQDVDVSYILGLVNFHAVEFSGNATGCARITGLLGQPSAKAQLTVSDFRFQGGAMGTLFANVGYDYNEGQVVIDAVAKEDNRATDIKGYVSPKHNRIDLGITAHNTRGDFLESFCGSFMSHTALSLNGRLSVVGPLSEINLVGKMAASGSVRVTPVNVDYLLDKDTITFEPDKILFQNNVVRDKRGMLGVINGVVNHRHLSNFTCDIDIDARHLLIYDFDGSDGSTFYGTVTGSGTCGIKTRSGQVDVDVEITPEEGSQVVYNASSPSSITSGDFIHWMSRRDTTEVQASPFAQTSEQAQQSVDIPSDIHVNMLIHTTPSATLKVLMDEQSGDNITLNGTGTLRATYFNKGGVNVFGNYYVDHGLYRLTIQNVIRRDFVFTSGGSIVFGGNPLNASLNLSAQHVLNSVSLSGLNIGRSFTNNNIRVNCLMNITGTPESPKVEFGLDMPTVSSDIKQTITSIINSEEEMNQQVLYLLAVGRFYAQGNNNAATENAARQSQTSLAMQSILSGQISQQINAVLGNVVNSNNWNFGANISTGDAGFNNAEYEGLLSGRLLNNRLLVNGQFGYRDNANATTSFIGDFDIRYLLYPNGNFAIRVYNQTNDRYFTRNSLTTQGLGVILKRDFSGWSDLFGKGKKKDKKKEK